MAIHGMWENMKQMIYEEVVWWVTTTYIWLAYMFSDRENLNYRAASDKWRAIWKIKKTIETVTWWVTVTETFFPVIGSEVIRGTELVWDDILTYTYL